MDRGHQVLALADYGQLLGVLLPRTLKVVIEDGLAEAVENAGGDHISLNVLFLEREDKVFHLLDLGVLAAGTALQIILLRERVVQESFLLAGGCGRLDLFLLFLLFLLGTLFSFALFDHLDFFALLAGSLTFGACRFFPG